jgi:hypothetical protein
VRVLNSKLLHSWAVVGISTSVSLHVIDWPDVLPAGLSTKMLLFVYGH